MLLLLFTLTGCLCLVVGIAIGMQLTELDWRDAARRRPPVRASGRRLYYVTDVAETLREVQERADGEQPWDLLGPEHG